MKRILVYGMTDNRGGIERYLVNLAYRLKDKIAFDYITDFPDIAHREELEEQGSKIFFIPAKSKGVFAHLKAFYKVTLFPYTSRQRIKERWYQYILYF